MNKNILTLILSIVVSVIWLIFSAQIQMSDVCLSSGFMFGCYLVGASLAFEYFVGIPVSVIIIPLIFGIVALIFSKEARFKQALSTFLISLLVSGVVILPRHFKAQSVERREAKMECERQRQEDIEMTETFKRTNPESIKNVYVPPPCE